MAITRSVIIDTKLLARLQTITVANGYHTNLGNNVFVWRPSKEFFEESELPAANIRDVRDVVLNDNIQGSLNVWDRQLTVEIDIAAKDITTYRNAVADVYKAFRTPDDTFDGTVMTTFEQGDETEVDEDELKLLGGKITINFLYRTNRYAEDLT